MNKQETFDAIRSFINATAPKSQEQLDWREVDLNGFTFQLLGCNGSSGYVRVEYLDVVIANENDTFKCFDADAAERALAVIESARRTATVSRLVNRAADDDGEEFMSITNAQFHAMKERVDYLLSPELSF